MPKNPKSPLLNCINKVFLILVFLHSFEPGWGQIINEIHQQVFEDIAEFLTSQHERQIDFTSLYEQLTNLQKDPVSINFASKEDLDKLFMLTEFQIQSLYNYIQDHGPLLSQFELAYIFGFDEKTIAFLSPFIRLDTGLPNKKDQRLIPARRVRHQLFLRGQGVLELQEGYRRLTDSLGNPGASVYLGSRLKLYTRYGFSLSNRIQAGFTAEKDQGEPFFKEPNRYGYDFYSGFVQVQSVWRFKSIIIGDFEPRFGQGLTLWSGLSFGKSPEVLFIQKRDHTIKKFTSTNENSFFRGMAATIDLGKPEIAVFFSSKKIDANILIPDSMNHETIVVSSLQESGIHATRSQFEDRKVLSETLYGFNINLKHNNFRIGTTFLGLNYGYPISGQEQIYQRHNFSGNSGYKAGFDYAFVFRHGSMFGETSFSFGRGWANIHGGQFYLADQLTFSVLYRNYAKDFTPLYSQAFGESSLNQNENGWYIGALLLPFRNWRFSAYVDLFDFPWLKWNVHAPSSGFEYHIQAEFNPAKNISMHGRFRKEQKQKNQSNGQGIPKLMEGHKTWIRYHVSYKTGSMLEFKNRVEWIEYKIHDTKEYGLMIYQDILIKPVNLPMDFAFRIALFDTDSYETRIYAYEQDVLYAYSILPNFGRGLKVYLMTHFEFFDHLDAWIRLSRVSYDDRDLIGSGLNTIQDNHKTELKIQLRVKF